MRFTDEYDGVYEEGLEDPEDLEGDFSMYEGYSGESTHGIKGVTDEVTRYTFTDRKYPYILVKDMTVLPRHKLDLIKNMVSSGVMANKDVHVYIKMSDGVYSIGMLSGMQVEHFIDAVGEDNLVGAFDGSTELSGSLLYTLCSSDL